MPRPRKCRCIEANPSVCYFNPHGVPMRDLETVSLAHDQWEALRLVEVEGLEQEEAAQKMQISRPTLSRMLGEAHKIVANAICNGKALKIEISETEVEK